MKSKLHVVDVVEAEEQASGLDLPEHVQLSLAGIAGQAKEGLLALAVNAGLAVLHETMEWEVERLVGLKGRHDRDRTAKRHGHTPGEVTLGARRVPISRPRVRTADDTAEIGLDSYQEFASRDLLGGVVLERMLAGVSTRKSRRADEPVGERVRVEARSTSKSAVSRSFVAKTRTALEELLGRDLSELELAVVMIDGIDLADVTHVVALGITPDGTKVPLSLREGSTENATVATALLADLVDRGLRLSDEQLYVLDGAKALRKAVRDVAGQRALVQRCQIHKSRNVCGHLPERERAWVRAKLRKAWTDPDHARALSSLKALAAQLEKVHPDAAGSLREGMEETLTLTRLGVTGTLRRTLSSTNCIESMFDTVRTTQRNVKRWRDGDMRLRWTAAGMAEAQRGFRRVKGFRDLPKLINAIHRELNPTVPTEEAVTLIAA
ncbi:MAG TPA: IS256 family transposase [Kofleriaceae bacterium]|nr:IS256 family transposase [Kofleriaceae bacterium]